MDNPIIGKENIALLRQLFQAGNYAAETMWRGQETLPSTLLSTSPSPLLIFGSLIKHSLILCLYRILMGNAHSASRLLIATFPLVIQPRKAVTLANFSKRTPPLSFRLVEEPINSVLHATIP